MRLLRRLLPAVLAFAWLLPAFGAGEFAPRLRAAPAPDTANGRVIVKYRADSTLMRAQSVVAAAQPLHAGTMGKRLGMVLVDGHVLGARTQSLRARGIGSEALARRLAAEPDVEWAVPDRRRTTSALVPNDPLYGPNQSRATPAAGQWYLRAPDATLVAAINAIGAWSKTLGDPGVTVAVLDTGVRFDHPDLAGKLHPGYDFIDVEQDGSFFTANDGNGRDSDASDPGDATTSSSACGARPSSWHGTQTAGLVGAATDNGIGMAGSGRNVMVLPVRVLGRCGGYDSDIIAGMRWAAGISSDPVANPHPAKVLNMSLGSTGACEASYVQVFGELTAAGVTVVVASGNEGLAVGTPANCPGAIAVAGVRHTGTKVGYSNLGPENFIAAPAGNCVDLNPGACQYPLLTTTNSGLATPAGNTYSDGVDPSLGTSFSSPLVAGAIGLMLSIDPTLTPARIRQVLKATARPFPTSTSVAACTAPSAIAQDECYCTTATCGAGMLDAGAAVAAVAAGGLVPPTIAIAASSTAPAIDTTVTLDAAGSSADGGRTISSWQWSVTGGTARASLVGATTGPTASLRVTAIGDITVQLVATDSAGARSTSSVTLYAAKTSTGGGGGSGGGGGALSTFWVTLLALAVFVLRRRA